MRVAALSQRSTLFTKQQGKLPTRCHQRRGTQKARRTNLIEFGGRRQQAVGRWEQRLCRNVCQHYPSPPCRRCCCPPSTACATAKADKTRACNCCVRLARQWRPLHLHLPLHLSPSRLASQHRWAPRPAQLPSQASTLQFMLPMLPLFGYACLTGRTSR